VDGFGASEGSGPVDPFDEFVLDDAFVEAATIVEPSAEERLAGEARRFRQLALARFEAEHDSQLRAEAEQAHWRARRRRNLRVAAWLALASLAATLVWVARIGRGSARSATAAATAGPHVPDVARFRSTDLLARPSPSTEERSSPIGRPPPVTGTGGYRFTARQEGSTRPVAYDPCRPIHYRVNTRTQIPGGGRLLAAAIAEVSTATGLRFVDDGETDEAPSDRRSIFQPGRYGDRWAPVLIAWSDPDETPELSGPVAGIGGSAWVQLPGDAGSAPSRVYVTGLVTLDGPDLARLATSGATARREVSTVLLHELGHLVGLDHVRETGQVMYPEAIAGVAHYRPGDRRGLARLGTGSCHADL
jgi:hypothetical protein